MTVPLCIRNKRYIMQIMLILADLLKLIYLNRQNLRAFLIIVQVKG